MSEISASPSTAQPLDVVIVGGGIAGIWSLNLLRRNGYTAVLLEADALGCQQTLGSQGMIHGGLKYALGGSLTKASEAISRMPERWRACLAGAGPVDLTGLEPMADRYHMFAEQRSLGRLTAFFASKTLRGRILKLTEPPPVFAGFQGVVYELNDFVLDTRALLQRLLEPVAHLAYRQHVDPRRIERKPDGWHLELDGCSVTARRLVLAAGAGNAELLAGLGIDAVRMQQRPLHQTVVRHPDLQPLYAHCLTGMVRAEPRLTITSHPDPGSGADGWLWYLGGQLATDGVIRSSAEQAAHARLELEACVPWLDWNRATFGTLRYQRAEPADSGGRRPDEAFVRALDGCLVCWPTKLSLTPDLGDRLLAQLPPPQIPASEHTGLKLPPAEVGALHWSG